VRQAPLRLSLFTSFALGVGASLWWVVAAGLGLLMIGVVILQGIAAPFVTHWNASNGGVAALVLLSTGGTLATLGLAIKGMAFWANRQHALDLKRFEVVLGADLTPCFVSDTETGCLVWQNTAAARIFSLLLGAPVTSIFGGWFAAPADRMSDLMDRALATGAARECLVSQRGSVTITAICAGDGRMIWRVQDATTDAAVWAQDLGAGQEGLALPMLRVDSAEKIVSMNAALRTLVDGPAFTLAELFPDGLPAPGELAAVTTADGPLDALIADLPVGENHREIYVLPVSAQTLALRGDPTGFEGLPVALARIDSDGALRDINREARSLLGLNDGQHPLLADVVEGLGRPVQDWLQDARAGRALNQAEVLRATHTGHETFLQVTLRRVSDSGRSELMAVLSDATELKTLEAKFTQSQKMQAVGQLAGGVAHDFNNLLTAISGYCDLLLLRHDPSDADYADLIQIHQNANRAASLVRQLLAFSRKQTLKPEIIDLEDTLSDLTHLLNRLVGERVTLTLSHGSDLGPIRADKRQLEQVIMNLVVNARDAMPMGGEIRVETEALRLVEDLERDRAHVPPGAYAVIRVIDEGVGIPPDRMSKIFEPFFTTKRVGEGTGLGLSTAYGIVKQTGGFIFVDSVEGAGTTFSLYFAIHDHPVVKAPRRVAAPALPPPTTGHILLVEDEAPVRAFAARALRMRGHTVLEAESGEAALDLLRDTSLPVDLFVTDVIMPGLDGPSWVAEARKIRADVGVIFISGYAEDNLSAAQSRMENSVFLGKPFSLVDLTDLVSKRMTVP
jgi:two-component system cell cycle sensor histidine kinase/response regulator CckA